jgi:regulatory protein
LAGRRARTGRGWDAAPPRARRGPANSASGAPDGDPSPAGAGRSGWRAGSAGGRGEAAPAREPTTAELHERAREICLRQLSFRPRTRAELAAALRQRDIPDEISDAVLDRYDEVGIIDDAAFARAWVSSRHHGRGLARRALADELRRRGVDGEIVTEALDDLDPATEAETARDLVDRKLRTMGSAPPDAVFRRLVAMLARKGYPAGVAIGAVKDALAARDSSAEFADQLDVDALADATRPDALD